MKRFFYGRPPSNIVRTNYGKKFVISVTYYPTYR